MTAPDWTGETDWRRIRTLLSWQVTGGQERDPILEVEDEDDEDRQEDDMKLTGIRILGLVAGEPSPFDGQWLVEYDPTRPGSDPHGRPMFAHIVTTPDAAKALRFPDVAAAVDYYRADSGLPYPRNRPLTAFTVMFEDPGPA
jgi:hypothetical protein